MQPSIDIESLLQHYIAGTLSEEDKLRLHNLLEYPVHRGRFTSLIARTYDQASQVITDLPSVEVEDMIQYILNYKEPVNRTVHRVHFLKTAWFRYAAAIIILFGIGAYLWNTQNNSGTITQTQPVPVEKDILPGGQKAMLTLADGRTIILDSAANGQLALENGSEVIKKDGQIIYDQGQLSTTGVTYNTMSTPKGGQYQLTLIDGTKVWLNAASSITYPTAFTQNTREIRISGEVYLEVAPDPKKPFKVLIKDKPAVEVLGTSFNINAYKDEPVTATTLIEGSVKTGQIILKPGQQARVTAENKISVNENADISKVMAWKNGKFNFEDLHVEEVMKLISRWYDIEVVYENKPPDIQFFGSMDRNVPLSTVLKLLERSKVKFAVEGKKLIVR